MAHSSPVLRLLRREGYTATKPNWFAGNMNDRLVLSSAYFNVTGGRRQDSADTFRVLASLQTHSGEHAALYAVSEASAPGPMGTRARRLVIDVIQREYTSRFDLPPPNRLKAAVRSAHDELLDEFQGHVRVGLTALIAEGRSLYLLQVPPAQAYVSHEGNLHSVGASPGSDAVPFAQSLGSPNGPEISLFRDTVEASDVIVLCSTWFARELESEELRVAFSRSEPDAITSNLFARVRKLIAREVTCVALQAVIDGTEEVADDVEIEIQEGDALWDHVDEVIGSLSYVWKLVVSELRPQPSVRLSRSTSRRQVAETTTEEPMNSQSLTDAESSATNGSSARNAPHGAAGRQKRGDSAQGPADSTFFGYESQVDSSFQRGLPEHGTEELPIVGDSLAEWETHEPGSERERVAEDLDTDFVEHATSPEAAALAPDSFPKTRDSELQDVNSFIQNTINLGSVSPPVQGFPDMTVAPERIYPETGVQPARHLRRFRVTGPISQGKVGGRASPTLEPRLRGLSTARPRVTLSSIPRAMWLWSGIGAGLVILAILGVVLAGSIGSSAIDYPAKAQARAHNALVSLNPTNQNRQLRLAWADIRLARAHRFSSGTVTAAALYVQQAADSVHRVTRLATARLLTNFKGHPNANPTQIAAGAPDLFVLDHGTQKLYSIDPSNPNKYAFTPSPGDNLAPPGSTPIVLWNDPVQLTSNGNAMVALDVNHILLTYTPGQSGAGFESLVLPASSVRFVASATFDNNYYLLDAQNGQIWRYYGAAAPGGSTYASGYLSPANPGLLKNAVGLAIDGDVYVALRNGRVLKFSNSSQVAFPMKLPITWHHATEVYTRQDLKNIFVFDARSGRILQLTKQGRYVSTLVLPRNLAPDAHYMSISADGRTVFFSSGHGVYTVLLPR